VGVFRKRGLEGCARASSQMGRELAGAARALALTLALTLAPAQGRKNGIKEMVPDQIWIAAGPGEKWRAI
jgi:hypothetical protein